MRNGAVVHEAYWNGGTPNGALAAFSVTKSLTATLVGIAADEGLLDLDDPAADYIEQWRGTSADEVTIRHLLSNVSGREVTFETDYEQMAFRVDDKTAYSIALDQIDPPESRWAYNNAAIQTLSQVLGTATGTEPRLYAQEKLFTPLAMADTTWDSDRSGRTMTFVGVSSTCLDLARFGQTMLDGGEWNGERIVSADFVEEATGESSSDLNAAYGLLWWVNDEGVLLDASPGTAIRTTGTERVGRLAPRAPDDAFWAIGFGGQVVSVVPSLDLVAVRMGAMPLDRSAVSPDRITGDLVDALE